MAKEMQAIDIGDQPELLRLIEEVRESQEPRVLRRNGEDLAILMPAKSSRRRRKGGPVTRDDALFRLVGIGRSGIPGGVSGKKHEYLGRVYRPVE